MIRLIPSLLLAALALLPALARGMEVGRLLRYPDIHRERIVFTYGGDLWLVGSQGGVARRITTHAGREYMAKFSSDGKQLAFTGEYDGHSQVYVIPALGGRPRQLTYRAEQAAIPDRMGPDNMVIDWDYDGQGILFLSRRSTFNLWFGRHFIVPAKGGLPRKFKLPKGGLASYSPDGKKLAYNRIFRNFRTWKRYRGGMAQDIWIYDLTKDHLERITKFKGTDTFPMWQGDTLYFTSDRGPHQRANIHAYDFQTRKIRQLTHFKNFDVNWPSQGPGAIVFEKGGWLHVLNLKTEKIRKLEIRLPGDRLARRPHWKKVKGYITAYDLSPDGKRAVFAARGDLYSVPRKYGNIRSLTRSPGVNEKFPAWSPDGRHIAYLSDRSGEDELYLLRAKGGKEQRLTRNGACFRFPPKWSPDSSKLAFADKNLRLYYFDRPSGKVTLVDRAKYWEIKNYSWSPDSRWLAYAKPASNHLYAIWLYSLKDGSRHRVTGDFTHDFEPVFDPGGKYLYFLSARSFNPVLGRFDFSYSYRKGVLIHALSLRRDTPSPTAPRSDEARVGRESLSKVKNTCCKRRLVKKGQGYIAVDEALKKSRPVKKLRIDLKGLSERVVALPVGPGNLSSLKASGHHIFYISRPTRGLKGPLPGEKSRLHRYELEKRKHGILLSPISGYALSADGKKLLVRQGKTFAIISAKAKKPNLAKTALRLSRMMAKVVPAAEWRQMFNEAWRYLRDYFYAPNMSGRNWRKIREKYRPLLPHVASRDDLNYVLGEMVSELGTSHTYVGGGDRRKFRKTNYGLLGVDFELDRASGRYRIKKIYAGQNWSGHTRSPLTEPAIAVEAGMYVLSIDGRPLKAPTNPFSLLENTLGRTVRLTVNTHPVLKGARTVTVKPVKREFELHLNDWVSKNRRRVSEATNGQVGYIYLSNMGGRGLNEFVKAFYPQIRKKGLIIDVRYNGGGFVDQMILERLRRMLVGMFSSRNAMDSTIPDQVFHGHLATICNHYSASDGDIFPYFFRKYGLGPIIGVRTWGGVVGIRGYTRLMDRGYITRPEFAMFGLKSRWIIENRGVLPDVVVDNRPELVIWGGDPQLEKAIELVLKKIKAHPRRLPPRPPYKK